MGHLLYSFETDEPITKYYSPIGNSDVPYPYAVGSTKSYFMLDKKTLPNELLDFKKDGYQQFYGYGNMTEDEKTAIEKAKKSFKTKMLVKPILFLKST